jgi:hypothetical protein
MQDEGFLLAIAQIAVTLAGFSGLVVAIRGAPPTAWHPRDIWSLSWMLARVSAPFHGAPAAIVSFLSVTRGTDLDSRESGDVCFYDRIRGGNGSFGSTSHEIGASATCPLFSHGRDAPAFDLWFFVGSGNSWRISASKDRILRFGSGRVLTRVSSIAGGVSSGAGAHSESALVRREM